jgi:5,10-methylene-tetrahydrofolate dehydrogenase/methenyl tetrahydrofolate cyclohydrolase
MPLILDGTIVRMSHMRRLKGAVAKLSVKPRLTIVQVGDDARSTLYIQQKQKFGLEAGIAVDVEKFPSSISETDLKAQIEALNRDNSIHGIIVQLPIPDTFNKDAVINTISPRKDVDGLTGISREFLGLGGDVHSFIPATAMAIMSILSFYNISVSGKRVTVMGRSRLVGLPTAELLKREGAIVSVCHSKTENPKGITKTAEILIVAIGKPYLVDDSYVTKGVVVIDVGINPVMGTGFEEEVFPKKVVGDVFWRKVAPLSLAITPVPGGVGPMTVMSLLENVYIATCAIVGEKPVL